MQKRSLQENNWKMLQCRKVEKEAKILKIDLIAINLTMLIFDLAIQFENFTLKHGTIIQTRITCKEIPL